MNVLQKMRLSFSFMQVLVVAVGITGAASRAVGQAGTGETVIQKATEQFENSPLKITSLGQGIDGNFAGIADDAFTVLTGRLGSVTVAVIRSWFAVGHELF
jgi:hypothetical protein